MIFRKFFFSLTAVCLSLASFNCFATDDADSTPDFFSKRHSQEERKVARRIFKQMVDQFNASYGLNLTPKEMCILLKENMDQLDMPRYMKDLMLDYIAFLESRPEPKNFPKDISE